MRRTLWTFNAFIRWNLEDEGDEGNPIQSMRIDPTSNVIFILDKRCPCSVQFHTLEIQPVLGYSSI